MSSLYVIIPAYNEAENIIRCIDEWYEVIQRYSGDGNSRLIIVDDGSKDSTYEIIKECTKTRPMLVALTKENGGHGSAVLAGYNYAIENNADFVFQTDSDGQTTAAEFDAFWKQREENDAIIGSRPVRGDGKSRKFVEDVVCVILKLVFGIKVKDANAPYRLMKCEKLKKYVEKLPKDFNVPNIMLTTYFVYYKDKVKFIDISFKPREKGTNSINIKRIIKIGTKAVRDFYKLRREM